MTTHIYFISWKDDDHLMHDDLDWFVEATSPREAVDIYLKEIHDMGFEEIVKQNLHVFELPVPAGKPGLKEWHRDVIEIPT